jgi:hypothetical protein
MTFALPAGSRRPWKRFINVREYFELIGVLLVVYATIRLVIAWELKFKEIWPKEPRWDSKEAGTAIDATKLSGRVEQLRQDRHAGAVGKSESFKKPLLVEEKRREMEKLAFFQKPPPSPPPPPPPEPPEHEEGFGLLLI